MNTMVVPYVLNSYGLVIHEAEEGGYWGEILGLPGCVSQGETVEELRNNIGEALEAVLESESETPHIEICTGPTLVEKEFMQFRMQEPHEEQEPWSEMSESVTATA